VEPILIAIAAAAAGKTTEAVTRSGGAAIKKAAQLVRRRFAASAQLDQAVSGAVTVEEFAEFILAACREDEDFRGRLSEAIGSDVRVAKFHNEFHGPVKNVVQAETIENLRLD
jgi:hypothetical protein